MSVRSAEKHEEDFEDVQEVEPEMSQPVDPVSAEVNSVAAIKVVLDRAFMAAALEEDVTFRRRKDWPEVGYNVLLALRHTYVFIIGKDLLSIQGFGWFSPHKSEQAAISAFRTFFPLFDQFRAFSKGSLVAAGGSATHAMNKNSKTSSKPKDCDMFWWGVKVEEAEAMTLQIIDWWLKMQHTKVYRSQHVTTFTITDRRNITVYQIIHRVYPTKMSIIGGFDLTPCAVLFDGDSILFTPLSVLTFASEMFFVDISRQSASFSMRIRKYAKRGFTPLIAAKTYKEISGVLEENLGVIPSTGQTFVKLNDTFGFALTPNRPVLGCTKHVHQQDSEAFDYDGVGFIDGTSTMVIANTRCLALGKFDALSWTITLSKPEGRLEYSKRYLDGITENIRRGEVVTPKAAGQVRQWLGQKASWVSEKSERDEVIDFLSDEIPLLKKTVKANYKLMKKTMKIVWLGVNDNPSRQLFTSSFRYIDQQGSWIQPMFAHPLYIGIPYDVYKVLALGRLSRDCNFFYLARDLFKYFMNILRQTYAGDSPIQGLIKNAHEPPISQKKRMPRRRRLGVRLADE